MSNVRKITQRFLVPRFAISLYYFFRFGARVSPRAEVELSGNMRFGRGCVISSFSKFKATSGPVVLGPRCGFATGCFVSSGEEGINIGKNFVCGPNVSITASTYRYDTLDVHLEDLGSTSKGVRIGDNVWVGANSTIVDGADLGDNTVVVANSLVNRRYPPNSILQGTPAKVIFKRLPSSGSVDSA